MALTNNVIDLSIETRKAIRDKAISSWMTADQVKTQLGKVWITQTNPVVPVAKTPPAPIPTAPINNPPSIAQTAQTIPTPIQPTQTTLIQPTQTAPIPAPIVTPTPIAPITKTPKEKVIPTQKVAEVKPPTDLKAIQTVEDWKKQTWWWLWNLESWLEARYWTVATQEWDKVTATIWDKKYQWNLDQAGNPIKTEIPVIQTQDDLFQTILGWWQVDKNNQFYKEAYNNVQKYNFFKWMNENQLSSALKDWLLLPWTNIYNELIKNPENKIKIDKANSLNLINWDTVDVTKAFENKSEELLNETKVNINWQETTLWKAMADWFISQSEYNQVTNNSEVIAKYQEVEDLKNKYDEIQSIYDNIASETEASLKWTWATKSDLQSLIWEKQKNIKWNLDLAESRYRNAVWTLTQLKADSTALFNTNLWLYKEQQAKADSRAALLEQRAYNEQQYQQQLKDKFDYEYWDLNSTNPQVQKVASERIAQAIQTQYAWMPFRRDVSVMWADILNEFKSGKTIEQITTDITNAIQNAPAYEQWAMNKGLIAQPQTQTQTQDWTKLNDWTLYNQKTGEVKQAWTWTTWWGWVWKYTIWNKWFTEWTWTSILNTIDPTWTLYKRMLALWMQEWWLTFEKDWWMRTNQALVVDKATWKLVRWPNTWLDIGTFQIHWWSEKEAWDKFNNNLVKWSEIANQIWMNIDINSLSNQDKQIIAHIWYINNRFPWALESLSNPNIQGNDLWRLIEKIQWSVKGSWSRFLKHLNSIQEVTWWWKEPETKKTSTWYTDAQLWVLSSIESLTPTNLKAIKEAWLTVEDFGLFKNWWLKPTSSQVASANTMVTKIDDLINHPNLYDAVWAYDTITPTLSWKTNDFKNKFNAFIANLAKDNLGQLKWPMSDKDVQFIKDMSSVLNTNTDEDSFIANLKELKSKYSIIASWKSLNESINGQAVTPPETDTTTQVVKASNWKSYNIPVIK